MIKAEIMAQRRARSIYMSPERKKQARDILYNTQNSETKWLKMSNAIPANHDFQMAHRHTPNGKVHYISKNKTSRNNQTRSMRNSIDCSLPPLTPKRTMVKQDFSSFSHYSTEASEGNRAMRNNFTQSPNGKRSTFN
jgi:hypothetical protein